MSNKKQSAFSSFLEGLVFNNRKLVLIVFTLLTIVMGYMAGQLKVDAGFKKQLPLSHQYMKTFEQYEKEFGGANRLLVALMADDGDMFTPEFFDSLEKLTNEVFFIPGVNRSSVRSIFTPNVRFVEIVEDGFAGGNVIPADFSPTKESFDKVRGNIVKSGVVGRLVSKDFKGAMIWAELMETNPTTGKHLDYQAVAAQLEDIRKRFEKDGLSVHIIGFAKIVGDIANGAKSVIWFLGIAIVITFVLLLLYSGSAKLALLPIVGSLVAVVWELGVLSMLGYGIDPMNMLTPFLIFAIGVSHGVQMINAWNGAILFPEDESLDEKEQPVAAAKSAFRTLLVPGSLALVSDTVGFMTILLIQIRIIQELAITASIGVAIILLTNLVLLPVLLSYTRISNFKKYKQKHLSKVNSRDWLWRSLAVFSKPRVALVTVLIAAGLFFVGYQQGQDLQIGDSETGVPELWPDSRYNQDARLISSRFALGVDLLTVIAETSANACTESYEAMENIDRFAWHMRNIDGVQKVITLPIVAKIINAGWNEGNIKWRVLSRNHYVMRQALQNIETDTGLLNKDCSVMPVLIFTTDHKASTITKLVKAVKEYEHKYGSEEVKLRFEKPEVEAVHEQLEVADVESGQSTNAGGVNYRLATGNVGVMAATNEDVQAAQGPMLVYVYGAIIILCLLTFRSITATLCIITPLALVSVLAYALMTYLGIGLKVNTLPVVALGVGIGVDYGIYIYSRLKEFLDQGMPLTDAYFEALKRTGKPVLFTAVTLAVGVGTWLFSDLKFQADMGMLLAFMFVVNMIGAIVLLPALVRMLVGDKKVLK
ncbi:MAG: efflux RND transporter permease subunit [bacterium]